VLIDDRRAPRRGEAVAGNLSRSGVAVDVDHHELVAIGPSPDALVDQRVWDRVQRAADADHRLPVDLSRLPEALRVRELR
jgi:hypothetical protein